jgi:hypothetical protein
MAAFLTGAATEVSAGPPRAGRYDAQLCVSVSGQAATCGAARARMMADGELRVSVDDFTYHLVFVSKTQLIGLMQHNSVVAGDFASTYRWEGRQLQFFDSSRGLRFELQLQPPGSASAPR